MSFDLNALKDFEAEFYTNYMRFLCSFEKSWRRDPFLVSLMAVIALFSAHTTSVAESVR